MEQKTNAHDGVLQAKDKEAANTKSVWETPELRVLPIPGNTHSGSLPSTKEGSLNNTTIYRLKS